MKLLEAGDKVRVFTREEVEAYVEAGGSDWCLLGRLRIQPKFGEICTVEFRRGEAYNLEECIYVYPEEILELV